MMPQPLNPSATTTIIYTATEALDEADFSLPHAHVGLKLVTGNIWMAQTQFPPLVSTASMVPALITAKRDGIVGYQVYALRNHADPQWTPTVAQSATQNLAIDVHPKGTITSLDVERKRTPRDFQRGSFLDKNIQLPTSNLSFRGLKTISLRSQSSRGDSPNPVDDNQRDELLLLNINGNVGRVTVNATIQDGTVDLDDVNKNSIELKTDSWELFYGEYFANLSAQELTSFHKRLDGVKGIVKGDNWRVTAMTSEAKGRSTEDKFYGENAQGPYQMSQSPMIVHSESVVLNGVQLVREVDYVVDYELGQITFTRQFLTESDYVVVNYEYSDSLYKRTFTAVEAQISSENGDMVVLTYLEQKDDGGDLEAKEAESGFAPPQSHSMVGISGVKHVGRFRLDTEMAFSNFDSDSRTAESEEGFGLKQGVAYESDALEVAVSGKTLDEHFNALGNPGLKPGLWGYDTELRYAPNQTGDVELRHFREQFEENNGRVEETELGFLGRYDGLSYGFLNRTDTDFSDSDSAFEKEITRHTVLQKIRLGYVQFQPGFSTERQTDGVSPETNFTSNSTLLNTQLIGLDRFVMSTQTQWSTISKDTGQESRRNLYGINTEMEPWDDVVLGGGGQYVEDSETGVSTLADAMYSIRPNDEWKLAGNYSLETLQEFFGESQYRVHNHQGNFRFTYQPISQLKFNYKYKPIFSEIPNLGELRLTETVVNQYTVDAIPFSNWSIGVDHKTTDKRSHNRVDIPEAVLDLTQANQLTLMQTNYQPDERTNVRYTFETESDVLDDFRDATPNTQRTTSQIDTHEIDYSRQIWQPLRAGIGYKRNTTKTVVDLEPIDQQNSLTQTVENRVEWQVSPKFRTTLSAGASFIEDRRGIDDDTTTVIPRIDIVWRPWRVVSISGFHEWTHSVSGETVEERRAGMRFRWDLPSTGFMEPVFSFQFNYQSAEQPVHYESLDVLGKLSLIF